MELGISKCVLVTLVKVGRTLGKLCVCNKSLRIVPSSFRLRLSTNFTHLVRFKRPKAFYFELPFHNITV